MSFLDIFLIVCCSFLQYTFYHILYYFIWASKSRKMYVLNLWPKKFLQKLTELGDIHKRATWRHSHVSRRKEHTHSLFLWARRCRKTSSEPISDSFGLRDEIPKVIKFHLISLVHIYHHNCLPRTRVACTKTKRVAIK